MNDVKDMVDTVVGHLGDVAQSRTVVGQPIKVGDVTLVILSLVSVGMGAGGGEGEGQPTKGKNAVGGLGKGGGEGAGGGAKVRPAAVVAISAAGVKVHPIPEKPGTFDKILERVPEVVDVIEKVRVSFAEATA